MYTSLRDKKKKIITKIIKLYVHGSSKQQIIGLSLQFPLFDDSIIPLVSIFLHPIYEIDF